MTIREKEYQDAMCIQPENIEGEADRKVRRKNRKILLEKAWHVRDFEIEMHWKRALYFAGFISVIFLGYIDLKKGDCPDKYQYLYPILTGLGLLVSYIWYLANRASKFLQENWEHHIDQLEDDIGKLYKTILYKQYSFANLTDILPISVSRASIFISLVITFGWFVLFGTEVFQLIVLDKNIQNVLCNLMKGLNLPCSIIPTIFFISGLAIILLFCAKKWYIRIALIVALLVFVVLSVFLLKSALSVLVVILLLVACLGLANCIYYCLKTTGFEDRKDKCKDDEIHILKRGVMKE
ncbi:hypothetical protein RsTz2092_13870 [Deferribacterales bacterium RsTz2092]|nr:hypothetical protein AGMMS49941_13400 [Deferribacterales bacterium]